MPVEIQPPQRYIILFRGKIASSVITAGVPTAANNVVKQMLHRRTTVHFHLTPTSVQHQTSRLEAQTYLKLC